MESGSPAHRKASLWEKKNIGRTSQVLSKSLSDNALHVPSSVSPLPLLIAEDVVWISSCVEGVEQIGKGRLFIQGMHASQKAGLASLLREHGTTITTLVIKESALFASGSNESLIRAFESLVALEQLTIQECDMFDKLVASLFAAIQKLPNFRLLHLVRVGLTKAISESLRELVQCCTSLETLAIREEQITEQSFSWDVSSAIGDFRTNVNFYLSQNKQLRALAQHATQRPTCGVSLSSRRLEEVPRAVFGNTAQWLAKLDLSCNCLTSLSESIDRLDSLTYLDVSCNQLSVLPPQLLRLTKLQHLNVAHNELVELSEGVGFLRGLSFLNVSSNRLRELPMSLACMPSLREAILQDPSNPTNKFRFPSEVLEGGSLSILTHLKYCLKRTHRYPVVSVFCIGNQACKTRLMQMLAREDGSKSASNFSSTSGYIGRARKTSTTAEMTGVLGKFHSRSGNFSLSSQSSDTNSSESETQSTDDGLSVETWLLRLQLNRSEPALLEHASPSSMRSSSNAASGPLSSAPSFGHNNNNEPAPDAAGVTLNDMQLEVWDFSGYELMPLFQRRGTVFVVCVNVASERFSAMSVIKMIRRIPRLEGTRIMLFGTYVDAALPPAKLTVAEAELDRVIALFPGLVLSKLLLPAKVAESKSSRKLLRDLLTRLLSETWSQRPEVPASWVLFGRMLVMMGSVRTVPVLTWSEMVDLASCCGISGDASVIEASRFVAETGHITFSEAPGEDWSVLNTSWMTTMWSPLRLLHSKPEVKGLVSADELVQAWQSTCMCPTWATRPWIALLKRLKMVLPIPQLRLILVPHLLATERPSDLESRFWPAHCLPDQMQYSRIFTLAEPFRDELLVSQLALRLLRANWNCTCIWLSGLVMQLGEELLLVECNSSSTAIRMSIRAPGVSLNLITLIFWMTSIIEEQCHARAVVEIPCIHCMQLRSYDPYLFSRAELEDAVASGKGVVLCRSVNPILIHSMAPDISMAGISAHVIEESAQSLGELQLIGEGGFAKVYRGKWRGVDVAVKKLVPLTKSNDEVQERRSLFSDFRREVWLMSGLDHPNLVVLKGVCLEPCFAIVMEYMNAGTLHALLHNEKISGPVPLNLVVKIALDIAKGMEFLHAITPPIVHRDL